MPKSETSSIEDGSSFCCCFGKTKKIEEPVSLLKIAGSYNQQRTGDPITTQPVVIDPKTLSVENGGVEKGIKTQTANKTVDGFDEVHLEIRSVKQVVPKTSCVNADDFNITNLIVDEICTDIEGEAVIEDAPENMSNVVEAVEEEELDETLKSIENEKDLNTIIQEFPSVHAKVVSLQKEKEDDDAGEMEEEDDYEVVTFKEMMTDKRSRKNSEQKDSSCIFSERINSKAGGSKDEGDQAEREKDKEKLEKERNKDEEESEQLKERRRQEEEHESQKQAKMKREAERLMNEIETLEFEDFSEETEQQRWNEKQQHSERELQRSERQMALVVPQLSVREIDSESDLDDEQMVDDSQSPTIHKTNTPYSFPASRMYAEMSESEASDEENEELREVIRPPVKEGLTHPPERQISVESDSESVNKMHTDSMRRSDSGSEKENDLNVTRMSVKSNGNITVLSNTLVGEAIRVALESTINGDVITDDEFSEKLI